MGADVALVTENFWRKRLGADPSAVGRTILLNGVPHSVVGVIPSMPATWSGPNAEIWTTKPFVIPGFSHERMMRGTGFLRVIARLKSGASLEQTRAALPSLEQSYRGQNPEKIDAEFTTSLKTLPDDVTGRFAAGVRDAPRRGGLRAPDRVQQCRQSASGALQRTATRSRLADGAGRVAQERAPALCL